MTTRPAHDVRPLPAAGAREASQGPLPEESAPPRRRLPIVAGLLCAAYLTLVVLGATTSSLGYPLMRQDHGDPLGTTLGDPRGIRSDEFMVDTPLLLGMGASGSDSTGTPLALDPDLLAGVPSSGEFFTSTVLFDATLMRLGHVLPVESLFAARWWLPFLLLLLCLPVWLRRVGATPPMSWLATALAAAAPATAWWSGFPVRILGFAAAGCVLAMVAADAYHRRRWFLGSGAAALCGLLIARLGTWYIPWSITLAGTLLLATACWLLVDPERRRAGLMAMGAAGSVALALLIGLYWENWAPLMAGMDTVYPGARRSGAEARPLAQLFGAPGDSYFQLGNDVLSLNVSELSSGFTICAVWAAMLFASTSRPGVEPGDRFDRGVFRAGTARPTPDAGAWVLAVLAGATAVWLLWSTVSLGRLGAVIPVLNRVPAERAAQTVGFIAALALTLMLSRRGPDSSWRVPLLAAGTCAAVTAYAVSQLQDYAPGIGAPLIVGVSATVFVIVLTLTREPHRWRWTALAAAAATACVATANPLQLGLGDLRDSDTAQVMLAEGADARAQGAYWATDGVDTDSLLLATGVPSLSGIQMTGPDRAEWARIDPQGRYENAWNRGGSSIEMAWRPSGSPVVGIGAADQILVEADPCDLVDRGFHLSHVMSHTPLTNDCLTESGTLEWNGAVRYVYSTTSG